jgi:ribosomal-protein-alanine N-acetyltransferase
MAIENASHLRPWTRGNFVDSLASGYIADALFDANGSLIGYCVAAPGVDEMHLLNLSVAPASRRRGSARYMLEALVERCRHGRLAQLWLEVRVSNEGARRLYGGFGLHEVGLRPAYYPASPAVRAQPGEDAVLMRLLIEALP